MNPGCRGHF